MHRHGGSDDRRARVQITSGNNASGAIRMALVSLLDPFDNTYRAGKQAVANLQEINNHAESF